MVVDVRGLTTEENKDEKTGEKKTEPSRRFGAFSYNNIITVIV